MAVAYNPGIVTDGLVLCLDAANKKSYPGSGTAWNDLSPNTNNTSFVNGCTFSSENLGYILFDGTDDRVITSNNFSFSNNSTWEAWVQRTSSVNSYNMFMGRTLPYFGLQDSAIIFSNSYTGSGQQTIYSTGFTPVNNIWYYLVFTTEYTGTHTIPRIYINGVLNNSGSGFTGAQGQYSQGFAIGEGRATATWYPFQGNIACVKIYDKTLSPIEIQNNFNAFRGRFGI